MAMTKKDFIALAKILGSAYRGGEGRERLHRHITIDGIVDDFITYAKLENPRFNEGVFRTAVLKAGELYPR